LKKCAKIVDERKLEELSAKPHAEQLQINLNKLRSEALSKRKNWTTLVETLRNFNCREFLCKKHTIGKDIVSPLEKLELYNGDRNYLK
jgi:hypothetical protein